MVSRRIGRYILCDSFASGGMAAVHLGRTVGEAGFSRTIALKRLHPHLASDPEFVAMFLDEARLASRIHHPNVVATLDVFTDQGELFLVMEHVLGESWWHLLRAARANHEAIPFSVITSVIADLLHGLHAAHEARLEDGTPLEIVHRDISPHNVLVGVDGVARVVDFGIAKAISRVHSTRDGEIKGKLAYMAPEQIQRGVVDRRADIYAAGVVLWESLTGTRLFQADDAGGLVGAVLEGRITPPSLLRPDIPAELDALVLRAVARDPAARFATALEFADALEAVVAPARRAVEELVSRLSSKALDARRALIASAERVPADEQAAGEATPINTGPTSGAPRTVSERARLVHAETQMTALPSSLGAASIAVTEAGDDSISGLPPDPSPSGSRRRLVGIGLFIAVASVSALTFGLRGPPKEPVANGAELAPSSSPSDGGDAGTPGPELGLGELPAPSTSTSPSSSLSSSPSSPSNVVRRPSPNSFKKKAVAPTGKGRSECEPNYTLEANGVKRFKPQCL